MPNYTFTCTCGYQHDMMVSYEKRDDRYHCPACGSLLQRQFPFEAARNFISFDPYYHEGLGVDIRGRREHQEICRYFGITPAGDKVGGARNEEKSPLANRIEPQAPTGRTLADAQREQEEGQKIADDFSVRIGPKSVRVGDMPAPKIKKGSLDAVVDESVSKGIAAAQL